MSRMNRSFQRTGSCFMSQSYKTAPNGHKTRGEGAGYAKTMNCFSIVLLALLVQEDSRELDLAVRKLEPAAGLRVDLFAGEPQLANPVGLWVDDRGRVFVAETHRYNTAALYVKQHSHWYFDDLACRTVADRDAMARKFMGADVSKLTATSEIVRLLEDRSGAGRADTSTVFADGFNSMA